MAFAQLTYRESLRDIEACLRSVSGKLYHMGFRGKVARSTLADARFEFPPGPIHLLLGTSGKTMEIISIRPI